MSIRPKILSTLGVLAGLPIALVLSAFLTEYKPAEIEKAKGKDTISPQTLSTGQTLKILSWNLQYCGSRKHHFFYDGGETVHVPKSDVVATMSAIESTLKREKPDIALLQEIDRNAKRTSHIDQLRELISYRNNISWVAAPYHKAAFVPAPTSNPMGRVDMNLGILSVFRLENSKRIQLALLNESRIRQMFNLKRAILETEIPLADKSRKLHVGVTHLSAFSYGDGTLAKQIERIEEWMASHPPEQPWILSGDFNLLPPGDDPKRLGDDARLYSDSENPMSRLIPKYKTVFVDLLSERNQTYLPFGAQKPNRKIDYIFYGGPIEVLESKVLVEDAALSDHLPLVTTIKLLP